MSTEEAAWKKPGDIVSIPRIDGNGSAKITRTSDELLMLHTLLSKILP